MTPEQLKDAVAARCQQPDEAGKPKAINWASVLNATDRVLQSNKGLVEAFTPAQADFVIEAIAAAVHDVNTHVNPPSA